MNPDNKNNLPYLFRRLDTGDFESLFAYLTQLSAETKKRFGPHAFDQRSIINFFMDHDSHLGYIALDLETNAIVAYAIIKAGCTEHDRTRLESYGLIIDPEQDSSFAPSVADNLHGSGLGTNLFQFISSDLKTRHIKRVFLWGGVQADNERAINYYLKNGFTRLGQFEHNGLNYDMIFEVS